VSQNFKELEKEKRMPPEKFFSCASVSMPGIQAEKTFLWQKIFLQDCHKTIKTLKNNLSNDNIVRKVIIRGQE